MSALDPAVAPAPLPRPRTAAVVAHSLLDLILAAALMLALSLAGMLAWSFWRGLDVAMRQPGLAPERVAAAIGQPGPLAQILVSLLAMGGAAVAVYLLRRRANREQRAAAWQALRRPATWGWALGTGLATFGLSAALSELGRALGAEPVPTNVEMIQAALRSHPLLTLLFAVALAPAYEELLFRRVLFGRYWAAGLPWLGIAFSSLAFALLHELPGISQNGPGAIVLLWLTYAAIGAAFAWVYRRTGSLWAAVLAHGTNNLLACALLQWQG
ncbi:CPBP family intramembrane glutamic endopeptidase [Lysobacter silvisoli]|uniref:CPBP family intramembrane metalloprotease n=1 Tax=Lysobacter silvisoli TaxID=2293254 RepID=A0A371JY43_9GAMM|nr:CPBP family intramembrane glutamic endopeptidase [Lysobacter silvisoli]RDZ26564.1 CPBP family intramembrane metalloprotease [Lysobacter silvisoli]